ncbi:AAC(3) family N-acetyltransferase [Xenorhabdus khoisanae]|uniref:AAC(3) family N-acetyltransferase n=1 Tax=Xenorhabdus khoisanae TaxID=880157 RepID=UPI0032B7F494
MQQRMHEFKKILFNGLCQLGIKEGDNIFIHSSLIPIYYFLQSSESEKVPEMIFSILRSLIKFGVISCLSGTWEANSLDNPFDKDMKVSTDIGEFSEFLRTEKSTVRSMHPIFSLVFNTLNSSSIFYRKNILKHKFAFGINSPWMAMITHSFKIVCIGLPGIEKMTLMHHVEQLCGVPYVYNKIIQDKHGDAFSMSVPYRNKNIVYNDQKELENLLISRNIAKVVYTEIGPLYCIDMASAAIVLAEKINDNEYYLLKNEPLTLNFKS